jgi:hypothetical protein
MTSPNPGPTPDGVEVRSELKEMRSMSVHVSGVRGPSGSSGSSGRRTEPLQVEIEVDET